MGGAALLQSELCTYGGTGCIFYDFCCIGCDMEESKDISKASKNEPVGLSVAVLFYVPVFIDHEASSDFLHKEGDYSGCHGANDAFLRGHGVAV